MRSTLTKVHSRKTESEIDYTTPEHILEELKLLERQKGWSILEAFKILKERKADSFSFTQDRPYHYFYARITEEVIIIKLRTEVKDIEFRLPLESLEK